MKKEEVLQKVRKVGMDEREEKIDREAQLYGLMSVIALSVLFEIWKILKGMPYADMISIINIQLAAISFYKYKKCPEQKIFLVSTVLMSMATLITVIIFFIGG